MEPAKSLLGHRAIFVWRGAAGGGAEQGLQPSKSLVGQVFHIGY